jgi:protein-S-isoprenylcysteine O-methyltransferase Ste14
VAIGVPALIVSQGGADIGVVSGIGGAALIFVGLVLVVWTVRLFVTVGRGTLAPWDPTSELVVRGPYRHVRNPMISGVGFVLAGEALACKSLPLLAWFAAVALANAIYIPLIEEPGLEDRFGPGYAAYRANVRRWIPHLRAWPD